MGLSIFYGVKQSDEDRLKFLDHVYESGEHNWDSSDVYGDSEDLLGKYVTPKESTSVAQQHPPFLPFPSSIVSHFNNI